jgi:hypothetical protein
MKIIFSSSINQNTIFVEELKKIHAISNYWAQSHNYETVLYGNELDFKILGNINYNEKILLEDSETDLFPKYGNFFRNKIIALSKQTTPFFYLDFDICLINPIEQKFLNSNNVFLYRDLSYETNYYDTTLIAVKTPKFFNKKYKETYSSFIIGGQNYKQISETSLEIIECLNKNGSIYDKLFNQYNNFKQEGKFNTQIEIDFYSTVYNYWLPNLLQQKNFKVNSILEVDDLDLYTSQMYKGTLDHNFYLSSLNLESKRVGIKKISMDSIYDIDQINIFLEKNSISF